MPRYSYPEPQIVMDIYQTEFEDFDRLRPSFTFNRVDDLDALNRRIAREAVNAIRTAGEAGRQILIITPVGPLDYGYWARLINEEQVSCEPLVTLSMDEYLDGNDALIPEDHPLSFRRFIHSSLVDPIEPGLRPDPANIHFPDPDTPEAATALVESFGGADYCFGGMGITGHFAFNDPPEPGEPVVDSEVRSSRTRKLTISRESTTQMAMGGVNGNLSVLPTRAVTLGMYELLRSRKIHLTFMRSWHAGVLRRALFGPVTGECPGSFIQDHDHVEVTVTALAARPPVLDVSQATGETEAT